MDGGPTQPRKPAFVSPQQPQSGFRDSTPLPHVRRERVTWPNSETYRWGDRHEKDKAAKRGGAELGLQPAVLALSQRSAHSEARIASFIFSHAMVMCFCISVFEGGGKERVSQGS